MSRALPRFVVLKPSANATTYLNRNDDGSVAYVQKSAFDSEVKIEAERAKINSKYTHLRFDHSNRYWQKSPNNNHLVAVSTKREEDLSKESCTLFEVTVSGSSVSFIHVPTGLHVDLTSQVMKTCSSSPVFFVDWSTLVKLPKHVAFKGDDGKYVMAYNLNGYSILRLGSNDCNDEWSGHELELMDDGHIRIKSDFWLKYWNTHYTNTIFVTSPGGTQDTLFWPVRIDNNTIALRSVVNNKFLRRRTWDDKDNCLIADVSTMTAETRLKVQELVSERKIYNVRYRMEDTRIFNEAPYVAGTTYATNYSDQQGSVSVAITYTDEKSYSFSNSLSITAGVATTFECGLPCIASESIEISSEVSMGLEWNKTTTTTTSVTATGSIPLPPRSRATVSYVGTRATCDVPFSYTYQDRSSVDGTITETEAVDGFYTGVNSYDFTFVVQKIIPL